MKVIFNFHSARARKARFMVGFTKSVRLFVAILIVGFSVLGVALWLENPVVGSVLIAISLALVLPYIWYEYDLSKMSALPRSGDDRVLEEVLAPDVVGRIRSVSSPYNLWAAIDGTWQQRFFCTRYSIERERFNLLSKEKSGMDEIWQYADELSNKHGEVGISTAAILVSLVRTMPDYQTMLAEKGMDIEELETSIDWIHHSERVLSRLGKNVRTGGLARDWTSGYTPTLNQMAHNMSLDIEHGGYMHRDLHLHRQTINEMLKFLSEGRQNVILVGDVGVGKTISVFGFVQRILTRPDVPENLKYRQVFMLNPSSIIASAGDASRVESTVIQIINEAMHAKNSVLFFDDASSFFAVGTGTIDLSKVIMPLIENGGLPVIFAMTPTNWQEFSTKNQAMAGMMNYLAVTEADKSNTLRILEDQSLMIEARHKVLITYQALEQSYDLAERYIRDIAFPGRALQLLENSVNHAENNVITAKSVQQSIEATRGVKVQVASGIEKQELLNLEDEIHKRMINQTRAVKVVSDSLRRARSGVNNPNKPVGTFLFLGPTGVGKTELAKAVSEVYFGKADNMVRVDMNEFTQSSDVERLIDSSAESGMLSSVGRDPFTVVLLDEIEKAHPEVVNVMLQMLDEGIMRDSNNREVSFRDAIVIATSNAGADSIRAYIEAGKKVEEFEKQFVDSLIDSAQFKPEFLNRFDESVVFRPLTKQELVQVVDLLLMGVNQNLSKQKVSVELTAKAKNWLVERGYDPRLGARPLRREVQRTVENVVAKRILQSDFTPGSSLKLDVADLEAEES